jgi:hypothetical protein
MLRLLGNPLVWKTLVTAIGIVMIYVLIRWIMYSWRTRRDVLGWIETTTSEHERERYCDEAAGKVLFMVMGVMGITLVVIIVPCLWIFA